MHAANPATSDRISILHSMLPFSNAAPRRKNGRAKCQALAALPYPVLKTPLCVAKTAKEEYRLSICDRTGPIGTARRKAF
jgi:hypothetical protein